MWQTPADMPARTHVMKRMAAVVFALSADWPHNSMQDVMDLVVTLEALLYRYSTSLTRYKDDADVEVRTRKLLTIYTHCRSACDTCAELLQRGQVCRDCRVRLKAMETAAPAP